MKKNYMRPESKVVRIQTSKFITASPNASLSEDKADIGDAESRGYDWDD